MPFFDITPSSIVRLIVLWVILSVMTLTIGVPIFSFFIGEAAKHAAQPPQYTTLPLGTRLAALTSPTDVVNVTSCIDRTCRFSLTAGDEGDAALNMQFGAIFDFKDTAHHYAVLDLRGRLFEFSLSNNQSVLIQGNYRVDKDKAEAVLPSDNTL
tara:strand:- start:73 stop:534 length:462 start_codon:yes stop_codon:yes gene_type:complete